MQLILAIEPDRRQSAKIATLARNQLQAELLVVDSVREGLNALDELAPDIILISTTILPKEVAALTERLRELDEDGLKVQTLIIPPLETPSHRAHSQQNGAPNRIRITRGLRAGQDCDPTVFGMQIATYLERAASLERPAASRAPVRREPAIVETAGEDTDQLTETEATEASVEAPVGREERQPEWRDVLSALRRDLEHMKVDPSEPVMPAVQERQERSVAGSTKPVARQTPPVVAPAPVVAAPAPVAVSAQEPEPALKRKRPKSLPPAQDEWGMFDPQQCGLAALRIKLNEISGQRDTKKPS